MDPLLVEFQLAVAGRYSIEREIGRGGMGIVYLAREVRLDRNVAIKLLPSEHALDEERRGRFLREARLAAKLSHPNIVPIFAVDDVDGFVFYAMAYVEGETLADRVRKRGPLPAHEATRVLREVAWALGFAHQHGVVHRDVKPDNILLEAGTGRALVTDFGIAAALGDETETRVAGTPAFMSPEQVLGKELDARSDLYGLGATAFFVCSGRPPFEGLPVETLAKQVSEPVPALATVGATVPRRLAQIVERCLAKDPAERPVSAFALAEHLGTVLEQRREVPAVLRGFVKRNGQLGLLGPLFTGTISMWGAAFINEVTSTGMALAFGFGSLIVPLGYLIVEARRVVRQGFENADLASAFAAEIAHLREESEAQYGRQGVLLQGILGWTAVASAFTGVSSIVVALVLEPPLWWGNGPGEQILGISFLTGIASYFGYRVVSARRPDVALGRWAEFWSGWLGRGIFALAGRLVRKNARHAALTHHPTELSLGLAAEELFNALPKESRAQLGDVPTVVKRLQDQAGALKQRLEVFQAALDDAGTHAEDVGYADIRAERDKTAERVRDVVAALEKLRLDLLRLHAGTATVAALSSHFGTAAELAGEIERLIVAQRDLDRFLREPRP